MPSRHVLVRPVLNFDILKQNFFILLFVGSFLLSNLCEAKDVTVFDVRRPLAMENNENPEKDYFFNAGSNDGLKKGMLVVVTRRQALYDQYLNKSPGDLVVPVGLLRIIHVQPDMSVARLESLQSRKHTPNVEFEAVMVGDKIDLSSARMAPRKTAAVHIDEVEELSLPPAPPAMPATPALLGPSEMKDFSSVAPQPSVRVNNAM